MPIRTAPRFCRGGLWSVWKVTVRLSRSVAITCVGPLACFWRTNNLLSRQDRCFHWDKTYVSYSANSDSAEPCRNSRHLSCLCSRHLSCPSSRHLSCLNSRHLSCLSRRHLFRLNRWCSVAVCGALEAVRNSKEGGGWTGQEVGFPSTWVVSRPHGWFPVQNDIFQRWVVSRL